MASWTDVIPQFKPYVEQLPVEVMAKVGMQKQALYEEGVKKIQSQIDSISGLDIIRDVDKNYLQSKLDEMGSGVRGLAAADFSNFQLVNSVTGMTKQITKDKYIQAAISSTANHRKQLADMESDKKKGNLTPDNEYSYTKQFSSYLNTGLKDESENPIIFSGKYTPHFDVFKFAKETFDAVKPDGFSFDQVYITDADGKVKTDAKGQPIYSPVMVRMEQEGIFPNKVKETLNQIFSDPRVAQQLNITGQYNYRNFSSDQLSAKILDQKQDVMAAYQNQLNELNLKKNSGKDVQKEIDAITQQMQTTASNYDEYAKLAATNPDGVRGQLYKDDVSSRYTTMFGQIKKKEQMLDNPGWNANFKLMQEANEQSRFAQELHQRKIEHADSEKWKSLNYSLDVLKYELAKSEKTKPGAGIGFITQGDQPADFDIIKTYENDYNNAATQFRGASDEFIWNNAFSGIGNNDATLKRLIDSGMDRNSAISLMLDNTAKASKRDPLEFRTSWGNKAEINYNKMTPQQRDANPSLARSYMLYKDARKNFDVMSSIKGTIDRETKNRLGAKGANETELTGMIPNEQVINFRGNNVKLSKQDIYDMAVYVRGNQSTFGFLNDPGANQAAKSAYQRLSTKGLADLADYQLDLQTANPTMLTKNPITGSLRAIKLGAKSLINPSDGADAFIVSGQVGDVYNKISNKEYEKGLQTKANIIKSAYGIRPNLKMGLVSSDVGVNRVTLANIKNMSGAYMTGQAMNLSPDVDKFAKYISGKKSLDDVNMEAQVIIDQNNKPQVELVVYGDSGSREGGMTIQTDEALSIGIDVNSLYESRDVSMLRNKMNFNNGRTSAGNPKDVTTYINGDVYFDRHDFKGMGNAPYDVKANIIYNNGIYYPVIFASDGRTMTKVPRELEGSENLQQVVTFLKQSVNPTLVSSILAESAILNP